MKEENKKDKKSPDVKKKQTTREKVRQHISDKNDVITDEDIRDAVVGAAETSHIREETKEILEQTTKKKRKINPLDILEDDGNN